MPAEQAVPGLLDAEGKEFEQALRGHWPVHQRALKDSGGRLCRPVLQGRGRGVGSPVQRSWRITGPISVRVETGTGRFPGAENSGFVRAHGLAFKD